jgi:hypothetical protein
VDILLKNISIFGFVEMLPNLSCRWISPNLITFPGLRPAAVATPIGIEAASLFAAIFRSIPVNPARKFILLGVRQGGGETPSCLRLSSFFEYRVSTKPK